MPPRARTHPYPTRCNNFSIIERKPHLHYLTCDHMVATRNIEPCAWNYAVETSQYDDKKVIWVGMFMCPHDRCVRMRKRDEVKNPTKLCVFVPDDQWETFHDANEFDPGEGDKEREAQRMREEKEAKRARAAERKARKNSAMQQQFPIIPGERKSTRAGATAQRAELEGEGDGDEAAYSSAEESTEDEPAGRRDTAANEAELANAAAASHGKGQANDLPDDPESIHSENESDLSSVIELASPPGKRSPQTAPPAAPKRRSGRIKGSQWENTGLGNHNGTLSDHEDETADVIVNGKKRRRGKIGDLRKKPSYWTGKK